MKVFYKLAVIVMLMWLAATLGVAAFNYLRPMPDFSCELVNTYVDQDYVPIGYPMYEMYEVYRDAHRIRLQSNMMGIIVEYYKLVVGPNKVYYCGPYFPRK